MIRLIFCSMVLLCSCMAMGCTKVREIESAPPQPRVTVKHFPTERIVRRESQEFVDKDGLLIREIERGWYKSGIQAYYHEYGVNHSLGERRQWYETGVMELSVTLDEGGARGVWRTWHQNGLLQEVAEVVPELSGGSGRNGPASQWTEDGRFAAAGHYREGKMVGKWFHVDSDGLVKVVEH